MITAFIKWFLSLVDAIMAKLYPVPSTDNNPEIPVVVTPSAPTVPPEAPKPPVAASYLWDTPKQAWHSARTIMDEMGVLGKTIIVNGVAHPLKDVMCACIYQESEFKHWAVGKPNYDGTQDFGLCQYNNGKNAKGIPLWIGPGAAFKDTNEVLNDPEKNVRVFVPIFELHPNWWASYSTKAFMQWLPKTSAMWLLAVDN